MRDALRTATVLAITAFATAAGAAPEAPPATGHFKEVPPPAGHSLGSVSGGNFKMGEMVIQKRCVSCHSEKVIKDAIAAGKNMQQIQERMELKGAKLSADDRRVLGIFWQGTPLKKK